MTVAPDSFKDGISEWLRRRSTQDMCCIPGRLAREIADHIDALASAQPEPYGWLQFIDGVKTQNFARTEEELGDVKKIFSIMGHAGKAEYVPLFRQLPAAPALSDDDLWHIACPVTELNGGSLFNVIQRECVTAIRASFMDPDAGRALLATVQRADAGIPVSIATPTASSQQKPSDPRFKAWADGQKMNHTGRYFATLAWHAALALPPPAAPALRGEHRTLIENAILALDEGVAPGSEHANDLRCVLSAATLVAPQQAPKAWVRLRAGEIDWAEDCLYPHPSDYDENDYDAEDEVTFAPIFIGTPPLAAPVLSDEEINAIKHAIFVLTPEIKTEMDWAMKSTVKHLSALLAKVRP